MVATVASGYVSISRIEYADVNFGGFKNLTQNISIVWAMLALGHQRRLSRLTGTSALPPESRHSDDRRSSSVCATRRHQKPSVLFKGPWSIGACE